MPITAPNYSSQQEPVFQRAMREILTISQAEEALITTTFDGISPGDHDYATGLIVRVLVPIYFGMQQMDKLSAPITVINSTQFTMPINTLEFDAFSIPTFQPGFNGTPAQVVPVGEVNELLTMATQNVLPYP